MTIWIDVEDLFEYAAGNPRPSGIQRLAFEIYAALVRRFGDGGAIRFVRHSPTRTTFVAVPWPSIKTLFDTMAASRPAPPSPPAAARTHFMSSQSAFHRARRRLTHRLPAGMRHALARAALAQLDALAAFRALLRELAPAARQHATAARPECTDIAPLVASGDVLMVLGAPWSHPDYHRLVARMREQHGMRFALLVYDIIPIRRPEWCDRSLVRLFSDWFRAVLPLTDMVFAISCATARDLERHARAQGIVLPAPIAVVPIGTGFTTTPSPDTALRDDLPTPGTYALIVSTIEARKNHQLLVRVWRQLLEILPPAEVPTLVFAGRTGWMVNDLVQQLRNTDYLGGKVVIIDNPTDGELTALYRGCLFTLFPSHYEGWGLPVTESLALGKPCVISNATSLPEAGGGLARYFDPDNMTEALNVIRAVIEDRPGLAAWQARIEAEFRPVLWDTTAEVLVEALA